MPELYWWEGNSLHIDILKVMAAVGIEDTPDNRDLAVREALRMAREKLPQADKYVVSRHGINYAEEGLRSRPRQSN